MTAGTEFLRSLAPPVLLKAVRRWRGQGVRFGGLPVDFESARAMSGGYDDVAIADRVARATRSVLAGEAAYERDSVVFAQPDFRYPVVAALMHAAALNEGRLEVIDFGGALGSAYWQCRPFLQGLAHVRWQVVEQATFVAIGQREFTTEQLSFSESLTTLLPPTQPQLILAGGVLQCLPTPAKTLDDLARLKASHLLIDRVPLLDGPDDHLCIQRVPAQIYPASYPTWIFSRQRLMQHLQGDWRPVSEFGCDEGRRETDEGLNFEFRGLYLERQL